MVQTLSETVIIPIAGLIITYVLCVELITAVADKNSLHDTDTWLFFRYFFKAWVAIFLVTHVFDISMAVFDVGQTLVNRAANVNT
jgi:ABC-type iron transport system FetAB ATPase subunit